MTEVGSPEKAIKGLIGNHGAIFSSAQTARGSSSWGGAGRGLEEAILANFVLFWPPVLC